MIKKYFIDLRIITHFTYNGYFYAIPGLQRLLKKTSTIEDGLESSDLVNGDLEKGDLTTLSDPWPLIEELTQKQTERSVGAGEQTLSDEEEVDIISCGKS